MIESSSSLKPAQKIDDNFFHYFSLCTNYWLRLMSTNYWFRLMSTNYWLRLMISNQFYTISYRLILDKIR